jgi:hypothetical protein
MATSTPYRKKSDSDLTDHTDPNSSPSSKLNLKQFMIIPSGMDHGKFQHDVCVDGDADVLIGTRMTRSEFTEFLQAQTEDSHLRFCFDDDDGNLFWVCPKESRIHRQACDFFIGLSSAYNADHLTDLIDSTGSSQQTNGEFTREIDFGYSFISRADHRISACNVVGEVLYSQSLADGHACAVKYLQGHSEILSVYLINLEYPWPKRPDGQYDRISGKIVCCVYSEHIDGNPIVPSSVVSFGPSPITADDMHDIVVATHCAMASITGHGVGTAQACSLADMQEYSVRIPGNVLLRLHVEDPPLAIHLQPQYDLVIDLFKLKERVCRAVSMMD